MKKYLLRPGFEFVFALSLIVILGLPPVLLAQTQKDMEIKIENGDTTINGKNIKELSPADRQSALNDINHVNGDFRFKTKKGDKEMHFFNFKRKDGDTADHAFGRMELRQNRMGNGGHDLVVSGTVIIKDSMGNVTFMKHGKPGDGRQMMSFKQRLDDEPGDRIELRKRNFRMPMHRFERRNSQHFDYEITGNDDISTHVSFDVSDAPRDLLKEIARVEEANLDIKDLNIVPQFTSGKTVLMFSLAAKTVADVQFKDSEGKVVWSDKATAGSFSKSFALGLNGVYYLQVKQGKDVCLKRIVKEE